jgi:TDG/mug DNA glycosylase family protein
MAVNAPIDEPGPREVEIPVFPDILRPGLNVVFCGLNPGLSSAALKRPFANPTNRFWRVLYEAGFTPTLLASTDSEALLRYGCGLTTAVRRATVGSNEIAPHEFADGAAALRARIRAFAPAHLAFMGKAAYRAIERRTRIDWGLQVAPFEGAHAWVMPNTSGLNRAFKLDGLITAYGELRRAAFADLTE